MQHLYEDIIGILVIESADTCFKCYLRLAADYGFPLKGKKRNDIFICMLRSWLFIYTDSKEKICFLHLFVQLLHSMKAMSHVEGKRIISIFVEFWNYLPILIQ